MNKRSARIFMSDLKKSEATLKVILNGVFKEAYPPDIVLIQQGSTGLETLSHSENLDVVHEVPYGSTLGCEKPTVPGQEGKILFGFAKTRKRTPVVILKGRTHLNEGYFPRDVAWPIFLFGKAGIRKVILTNAVGSTQHDIIPGSIGVITDHFNYVRKDPFYGGFAKTLGKEDQFVPMDNIYCKEYIEIAQQAAKDLGADLGPPLRLGKLLINTGPSFETEHEITVFREHFGIDFVGMSIVMEAMASKFFAHTEQPMKVLALSGVSNFASGVSPESVTHRENLRILKFIDTPMSKLILKCLDRM